VIEYNTADELRRMRESGAIVGGVLRELRPLVKAGTRTADLDAFAERRTRELGAKPAFKGYRGYPATLCVSVNEEVIHGIPSARVLKDGDVVSVDFGVLYEGFYGDAARTYAVGEVGPAARNLIRTAEASFRRGVEKLVEDGRLSDVSAAIQSAVEAEGFSVIRSFVGHGIGRSLHEEPQVPNFGFPGRGPRIRKGLVLAIEPMIAAGDWEVEIQADGWTAVTRDRSLAAHFEETVAVTERGAEILSAEDASGAIGSSWKEQPHA
jgi:methionyl aminopeptidase